MSNLEFGLKELYDVKLKSTYPMRIGERQIEEGEVITVFDKISLANFQEITSRVAATGGFDNRSHVIWETTKEIDLFFSQGIFSKVQFALLSNSNLITKNGNEVNIISNREILQSDEDGYFYIKEVPYSKLFVYNKNGIKMTYEKIEDKTYKTSPGTEIIVDYEYDYSGRVEIMTVGKRLVSGFLSLEGRTRVKDDITGHTRTGILKIPKLKLVSDLSMRLGNSADPVVANFSAVGHPVGERGNTKVMEFFFLEDDIDSDM